MTSQFNYDQNYYESSFGGIPYTRDAHEGHWIKFFTRIAEVLVDKHSPARTLDVGCAKGFLVEALRDHGVAAYGFDFSDYAISEVREDLREYCRVGSADDENMYGGKFDVITCIEVLEHVPSDVATRAMDIMTKHSHRIVFSSTPLDITEPSHINVRATAYWIEEFSKRGFVEDQVQWVKDEIVGHAMVFVREETNQIDHLVSQLNSVSDRIGSFDLMLQHSSESALVLHGRIDTIAQSLQHISDCLDKTFSLASIVEDYRDQLDTCQTRIANLHAQMNALQTQLKVKEVSLEKVSADLQETSDQLHAVQSEVQMAVQRSNGHNAELEFALSRLNQIESGRIFRMARKMWRVRDRAFPIGTRRRKLYRHIVGGTVEQPAVTSSTLGNNDISFGSWWNQKYEEWQSKNFSIHGPDERIPKLLGSLRMTPRISILVPLYKTPTEFFHQMANSVLQQTYDNWELVLIHDENEHDSLVKAVSDLVIRDRRIVSRTISENTGISDASNECLVLATGDYIALLDHDDMLTRDAVLEMVLAINENEDADLLYSDKDQINEDGSKHVNPLFKTSWSWANMMSANYPTHFTVIRRQLVVDVGGFDANVDGAQDWDLFLKVSSRSRQIVHVPKVLYHWRIHSTSVSTGISAKPYVVAAQYKTLSSALQREGYDADVRISSDSYIRVFWNDKDVVIRVFVIMMEESSIEMVRDSLSSVQRQLTVTSVIEVLCPLTMVNSEDFAHFSENTSVRIRYADPSEFIEIILEPDFPEKLRFVLYAGIEIVERDTIAELSGWLLSTHMAVASGMILDSNDMILNAGYVIRPSGEVIEPYKGMAKGAYTTFGSSYWYREYAAVTPLACMIHADRVHELLDENSSRDESNDVWMSLALLQQRLSTEKPKSLYSPFSVFRDKQGEIRSIYKFEGSAQDFSDPNFNENIWDWNIGSYEDDLKDKSAASKTLPVSSIWSAYSSDAIVLAQLYDFTEEDLEKNLAIQLTDFRIEDAESAIWFLPPFNSAYYGGIHTILRFADYLRSERSIKNTFVIIGVEDAATYKRAIDSAFPSLSTSSVFGIGNDDAINRLPKADISFCTLWTTAYALLKYNKTKRKFYFLQDFEPLFYPAGSTSAQVEATYRFGFDAVCNTVSLQDSYQQYGGHAVYFDPAVDNEVFHSRTKSRHNSPPWRLFLYGRPGNPRNGFEIAVPALKQVKKELGAHVQIVSAGSDWDTRSFGLDGVVEHLGMLPYEKTGELYRTCDVGLTMMMTRHPSYLPFELMSCECLVVALKNQWNDWLLRDGENCLLAEASVSCVASTLVTALTDHDLRNKITQNAKDLIEANHRSWDKSFGSLMKAMSSVSPR